MNESEIAITFGNRIREIRKSKHLTQKELAYKASINPTHLGQIERAQKNPTLDTIYQILNALGISLQEIFAGSAIPELEYDVTVISDKILLHLEKMSEYQQNEILHIIQSIERFQLQNETEEIDLQGENGL